MLGGTAVVARRTTSSILRSSIITKSSPLSSSYSLFRLTPFSSVTSASLSYISSSSSSSSSSSFTSTPTTFPLSSSSQSSSFSSSSPLLSSSLSPLSLLPSRSFSKYRKTAKLPEDDGTKAVRPVFKFPEEHRQWKLNNKQVFKRKNYPVRKQYLLSQYLKIMDESVLAICVQNTGKNDTLLEFETFLHGHFKVKFVRNKLMLLDGTPHAPIMNLFAGPTTLFYQTDKAKTVSSVQALLEAEKKFPQILILGGLVQGNLASINDLEAFRHLPSLESSLGGIIPMINSPTSLIHVLNNNNNTLIRVLEHMIKQKTLAEGAGSPSSTSASPSSDAAADATAATPSA